MPVADYGTLTGCTGPAVDKPEALFLAQDILGHGGGLRLIEHGRSPK